MDGQRGGRSPTASGNCSFTRIRLAKTEGARWKNKLCVRGNRFRIDWRKWRKISGKMWRLVTGQRCAVCVEGSGLKRRRHACSAHLVGPCIVDHFNPSSV